MPLSPLCCSFFWRASGDCTGSLSCSIDAHHADDQIPSFHSNTVSSLITTKILFLSPNIRHTVRSSLLAVSPLFGLMAPSPSYSVITPVNQIKIPLSTHMSVIGASILVHHLTYSTSARACAISAAAWVFFFNLCSSTDPSPVRSYCD